MWGAASASALIEQLACPFARRLLTTIVPRMCQATQLSQTHTDSEKVIVGVGTHKDVHAAGVISVLGVLLGAASFPTTATGCQQLLT
ncbi:MAG: hypothetical protein M3460_27245 [Actinomycetota bacterium]|nr:hypothetical protein [Actinomycetota bacterium]